MEPEVTATKTSGPVENFQRPAAARKIQVPLSKPTLGYYLGLRLWSSLTHLLRIPRSESWV